MQYHVTVNGKKFDVVIEQVGGQAIKPVPQAVPQATPQVAAPAPSASVADEQITSPMPGNIWQIPVSVGQTVSEGQVVIILEAMKMENEIVAPRGGVVKQILVAKDAAVQTGDVLVVLG